MNLLKTPNRAVALLGLTLASAIPGAALAASATVTLFSPLSSYGGSPVAPLINDGSGNLIGTICCTEATTTYYNGSLFSIAPDGTPTTLHAFAANDGYPNSSVVRTSDGSIYGATADGGTNSNGTIYSVAADGTYSVLHSFAACSTISNRNADGIEPNSLIRGGDGALYGTAKSCGPNGGGTVFRITAAGEFSLLHSFRYSSSTADIPSAPCSVVAGANGTLYGTSWQNGAEPYGSVFKITSGGRFRVLHKFPDLSFSDYTCPFLLQGSDGNFYGTATSSDNGQGVSGEVFKMTPAGKMTTLHQFQPLNSDRTNADGEIPMGLIQTSDGTLYGAAGSGGQNAAGTLYQLTTSGVFTKLYDFSLSMDGYPTGFPSANIVQGADGALYGMMEADLQMPSIFKAVISP